MVDVVPLPVELPVIERPVLLMGREDLVAVLPDRLPQVLVHRQPDHCKGNAYKVVLDVEGAVGGRLVYYYHLI